MSRHGHLGGLPPAVDLEAERRLAARAGDRGRGGLLAAAHDLSDGGLAVALAESCLRGGDRLRGRAAASDPFTDLFSESAARARGRGAPGRRERRSPRSPRRTACRPRPSAATGGDSLTVDGCFAIPLAELAAVHARTLPALFGPVLSDPVVPG